MTALNYVDDVMLMMNTQYATAQLGIGITLQFVNTSRKEAFVASQEIYPQLYTLKKSSTNPVVFADSDNFVRDNGVMVDPATTLVSARKTDLKSLRTFQGHTYEAPAANDPMYTRVLKTFQIYPTGGNGVVYYIKEPVDLAITDTETVIPAILWKLVVKGAVVSALKKMAMAGAISLAQADYQMQMASIVKNFQEADKNVRENLASKKSYQLQV